MPGDAAIAAEGDAHDPSATASPTVAILGGTGLLGSAIARGFLDHGSEVTVLSRHAPAGPSVALLDGATITEGDAGDRDTLEQALEGADHVVYALGAPHPADSARAPLAQFDAEVPVLLDVLDEVRQHRGTGFTYLSSGGAIYGDAVDQPVAEDAACHPVSPYGVTKLAAERYVLMAANVDGVAARILRVANAYGPLQRPGTGQGVIAAFLHAATTGETVRIFGDGSAIRDFVHVRDVAAAVVALSTTAGGTRVLNVGTGVGHCLDDVLAMVQDATGSTVRVAHEPARTSDVRTVVLDVSRLASLVEWHPTPLADGIRDMWGAWSEGAHGPTGDRSSA